MRHLIPWLDNTELHGIGPWAREHDSTIDLWDYIRCWDHCGCCDFLPWCWLAAWDSPMALKQSYLPGCTTSANLPGYFECPPKYGLFARETNLRRLQARRSDPLKLSKMMHVFTHCSHDPIEFLHKLSCPYQDGEGWAGHLQLWRVMQHDAAQRSYVVWKLGIFYRDVQ